MLETQEINYAIALGHSETEAQAMADLLANGKWNNGHREVELDYEIRLTELIQLSLARRRPTGEPAVDDHVAAATRLAKDLKKELTKLQSNDPKRKTV